MANFLVRIILHSKTDLSHYSYSSLHTAMENAGFKRQIHDVFDYKLPHAEYCKENSWSTFSAVHAEARAAANSVDTNNGVVTVEYSSCTTSGLSRA
jgi:hypothetical protein